MTGIGDELLAAVSADDFLRDLGLGTAGYSGDLAAACEGLIAAIGQVVAGNAEQYELVADQLEEGGLRDLRVKLAPAMRRDLSDWDPNGAHGAVRARERLYWLAVALADRRTADGDVDLRDVLARAADQSRVAYRPLYGRLLALTGREPIWGSDERAIGRLQDTITLLLEGVTVARRAGYPFDDNDVVTAAMALFYVFTRSPGQVPFDPEAALTGQPQPTDVPSSSVTTDDASSYAQAVARLQALRDHEPGIIRHASLHGISGVVRPLDGRRPAHVHALREATIDLVRRGWKLRRLVTLYSPEDLDREVAIARQLHADSRDEHGHAGTTRVHATVGGVGGHAATLVVDGHFATIGLDDPDRGWVGTALFIDDLATVRFWKAHFQQLFDDRSHTFVIRDRSGEKLDHIDQLRARITGLQRVLHAQLPPLQLTPAEAQLIEVFVANPGWTNQQIAGQLVKDPETVKKGLSALYRKFDVSGRAALLDALKQRGMA